MAKSPNRVLSSGPGDGAQHRVSRLPARMPCRRAAGSGMRDDPHIGQAVAAALVRSLRCGRRPRLTDPPGRVPAATCRIELESAASCGLVANSWSSGAQRPDDGRVPGPRSGLSHVEDHPNALPEGGDVGARTQWTHPGRPRRVHPACSGPRTGGLALFSCAVSSIAIPGPNRSPGGSGSRQRAARQLIAQAHPRSSDTSGARAASAVPVGAGRYRPATICSPSTPTPGDHVSPTPHRCCVAASITARRPSDPGVHPFRPLSEVFYAGQRRRRRRCDPQPLRRGPAHPDAFRVVPARIDPRPTLSCGYLALDANYAQP